MILDPDYSRIFTQARIIAWQYGYACVAHGSYTRDLDLLLVPWTENAGPIHDQLLKLIADAGGLRFRDGKEKIYESVPDWTERPHGRKSCSLFFREPADRRWVDVSIMPCALRQQPASRAPAATQEQVLDAGRLLTDAEIMDAFQEAFPGHDLHQESIDYARAVERRTRRLLK